MGGGGGAGHKTCNAPPPLADSVHRLHGRGCASRERVSSGFSASDPFEKREERILIGSGGNSRQRPWEAAGKNIIKTSATPSFSIFCVHSSKGKDCDEDIRLG